MDLKRDESLQAGVRLIWYIDPRKRTAVVHGADGRKETFDEDGTLSAGDVLPGFELRLRDFFDHFPTAERDDSEK